MFQVHTTRCRRPWPGEIRVKETIGLPLVEAFPYVLNDCGPEQTEALVEIYRRHWLGNEVPESSLFPGVVELLTWLQEKGCRLAVATGKSRVGLERDWKNMDLNRHFSHSRCAGEGRAKPDPDILQQIMVEAGVKPGDTLMIGDHVLDLDMAKAAGVDALGVTTGSVGHDRLMTSQPLAVMDGVGGLREFLA